MYPLLIAVGASLTVSASLLLIPERPSWIEASILGVVVFIGLQLLLGRLASKKVRAVLEVAQRHVQSGNIPKAIDAFEEARAWKNWQLFLDGQLNTEIGILHYSLGEDAKAAEFLAKGYNRIPHGPLVLGAILYRQNKLGEAREVLEKAILVNRDSTVLPSFLAWLLVKEGQRDAAIEVLEKAPKKARKAEETQDNLERLRGGKKMNMRCFGQHWFMLKFETPPGMAPAPVRKGFRQPPKNKGKRPKGSKKARAR